MFESNQQSPGLCLWQRQQKPDPFNPEDPHDDRGEDDDDNDGSQNIQDLSSSHFGFGQCNTFIIHSVAQFLISDVKMDSAITKEANFLDSSMVSLLTATNELGQSPPAFVNVKTHFIPNVTITPTAPAPAPLIKGRDILQYGGPWVFHTVLVLNCEVDTNPAPAISWYMDIQTNVSDVPRLQVHYPPNMTEGAVVEDKDSARWTPTLRPRSPGRRRGTGRCLATSLSYTTSAWSATQTPGPTHAPPPGAAPSPHD